MGGEAGAGDAGAERRRRGPTVLALRRRICPGTTRRCSMGCGGVILGRLRVRMRCVTVVRRRAVSIPASRTIWWWWVRGSAGCRLRSSSGRGRRPRARILLLDNHDDFGGHAKRNEFQLGGHTAVAERRHAVDRESASRTGRWPRARSRTLGIDVEALAQKAAHPQVL